MLEQFSEVVWVEEGKPYTSEQLAADIGEFDACITSWGSPKLTQQVLEQAGNLKFVGHAAGTVVPIVEECIFDRQIAVVNANAALAKSTAEAAIAMMMAGAWNLHGYEAGLQQGRWSANSKETVLGLYNQVIGLIGYGDISREVIQLLQPYAPQILLFSRHCTLAEAERLGVELCSLHDLLRRSRIISLHNTLTPVSNGMIGQNELALVQDGALIVNTARGPIMDEQALLEHTASGRLNAVLDVYAHEPLGKEHALLQLPNVMCLPHIGGYSGYWKTRLGATVIADLERFVQGESLQGSITREKFNRLTPR